MCWRTIPLGLMTQLWRFRDTPGFAIPRARYWVVAAILFAPLVVLPGVARADVFQLTTDESNALIDKAKAAVVQVRSGDPGFVNGGTGFFIDDQGTVLTSSTILGDNKS